MVKKNLFAGHRLPPGFRFHPTDVELIMYYLKRKVLGKKILHPHTISEVDIYKYPPWDLQHKACWRGGDLKWYFFCPAEKKYSNGGRMKRSTDLGYWKTTGKDRSVQYNKDVVGMIKTLVFHRGKAPKGARTDWVMYEYRLEDKKLANEGVVQDSYVVCMIFEKEGPGPKNGAEYGAPFREEDWEDDDDDDDNDNDDDDDDNDNDDDDDDEEVMVEVNGGEVFAPCPQQTLPPIGVYVPEVSGIDHPVSEAQAESPDELDRMLAAFSVDSRFSFDENMNYGNADVLNNGGIAEADQNTEGVDVHGGLRTTEVNPPVDGVDIFSGLGDLSNPFGFCVAPDDMSSYFGDNGDFLELRDFADPMDCQPDLWNWKEL